MDRVTKLPAFKTREWKDKEDFNIKAEESIFRALKDLYKEQKK